MNIDDHPTKVILKDEFSSMRLKLDGITFKYFFQELFLEFKVVWFISIRLYYFYYTYKLKSMFVN